MEASHHEHRHLGFYDDPVTLRTQFKLLTTTAMNSFLFNNGGPSSNQTSPYNIHRDEGPSNPVSEEPINATYYTDYSLPDNYTGDTPVQFSIAFQVIIYIIYNTVFVAALLGNILVCYVVFSSPRMRTVTNYLIANLALGDLLMALLCVPFSYISVLLQYWPFGQVLCHVVAPAQAVCVFVSAYTLVALAVDRYIAILYPLKPRLRRSQAVMVTCIVWVVAILTSSPIAIFTGITYNSNGLPECAEIHWPDANYRLVYSLTLMILQYFFPLAVLIFTYTRIALAVWGKKAPGEAEDGRDQRLAKAKRKMIKMMLVVVLVYTACWLPFNIIVVYGDLDETIWAWEHMSYTFTIIQWLALSHTLMNPIIYCWMNSRFRDGFRQAISNVPLLKKLTFIRSTGQEFQLHRMNTCTTYSFVPGKLNRNSSLVSNGRGRSPALPIIRNFSGNGAAGIRGSRYHPSPNSIIHNSPSGPSSPAIAINGRPASFSIPRGVSGPGFRV